MKQCSVLCWDGKLRVAVLPLSKPGWDEFSFSFCDLNQFIGFCWNGKLHFAVLPLSKSGWERFSRFLFDVKQCSGLWLDGKLRLAILPLGKPGLVELSFSCCEGEPIQFFLL